jgi:hypothetical protein
MPEATSQRSPVRTAKGAPIPLLQAVSRNEEPRAGEPTPVESGFLALVRNDDFLKSGHPLVASSRARLRNPTDKPVAVELPQAPSGSFSAPAAFLRNFND